MKKVIEISGNHGFDRGVVTYVQNCDLQKKQYALRPEIEYAYNYIDSNHVYITSVLGFIQISYPKAHVRLIQID